MSKLLEMKNISKFFPGVKALENVDFELDYNEVHCLIGANGAGKSTLMKVLSGVYEQDEGKMYLNNEETIINSPKESKDHGISIIHQELSLVEELTVAENIFLGTYQNEKGGFVNWKKLNNAAAELLNMLGENLSPKKTVKELSMGKKQIVEIAKALAIETKILIMDEPSTALSRAEIENMFKMVEILKQQGVSVIYISHKLEELYEIGDRITILRNGKKVLTDRIESLSHDDLIEKITGRKIEERNQKKQEINTEKFLEVKNLSTEKLKNINMQLGKGEIIGLYGLVGSGRTELLRAIYGADKLDKGKIYIEGKHRKISSPTDAVNLGLGLVPENRKTEGAILNLDIAGNISLPSLKRFSKLSFINQRKLKRDISVNMKKMNVKARGPNVLMKNLSGGNQQKVIIAKWLLHNSKVMLFDEPTQGIDVGAKGEIYHIIEDLAKNQGTSVLVASSEIDELLSVCNRIIVLYEGEIIEEFYNPEDYKTEILNTAVTGVYNE